MSDFKRMVYRYTIKESDKIKKICEPLHQQFGVKHFWYCQTTSEGGYFSLASNPEMHDYYHSSNLHLHSPFFHNPQLIAPGFYFYNTIQDKKFQESFHTCADKHQMTFGGSLVYKSNNTMYRCGYAFHNSIGQSATNIILNNLALLQKFNDYFAKESKGIIKQALNDLVSLPEVMGAAYNSLPAGLNPTSNAAEKCQFLQKLGYINRHEVESLSSRELEIMHYIHEGLSARLIACTLHISRRTVEKHLETIKNKLGCFTKPDLCHMAHLLHAAGCFVK